MKKVKIKKDKIFMFVSAIFLGGLFLNYVVRFVYFYISMK